MALVKVLWYKHEELSSDPEHPCKKLAGMVKCAIISELRGGDRRILGDSLVSQTDGEVIEKGIPISTSGLHIYPHGHAYLFIYMSMYAHLPHTHIKGHSYNLVL